MIACEPRTGDPAFDVVAEAANVRDAVRRANGLNPDVILMDLRMPELDGVAAIRALLSQGVPARVLVLTTLTPTPTSRRCSGSATPRATR